MFHPRIISRLPASQASVAAETLDVIVATLRENKGLSVRHVALGSFGGKKRNTLILIKMTV